MKLHNIVLVSSLSLVVISFIFGIVMILMNPIEGETEYVCSNECWDERNELDKKTQPVIWGLIISTLGLFYWAWREDKVKKEDDV